MASRAGRRNRKNSDEDYEEVSAAPTSTRPSSNRRATATEDVMDTLTPEEQYLLKVYRLFRKQTPVPPESTNMKRPASPIPPNGVGGKRPLGSVAATEKLGASRAGAGLGGVSETGTASKTREPSPPPRPAVPQPTDTATRLKMLLEKKRKEATGPRAGSAAAAAGASIQRKAKINKGSGGSSSSTGVKLDSVKYPISGLLLIREFRSFQEGEEDGERAYLPVDPLVRDLTNFGLPDAPGIKKPFHETLVMRITVPPHSQSWGINISPQDHHNFEEVLFHFNPRRRFVAMNNREDNVWGQQEKYMLPRWPDLFNVSVIVGIQIDKAGFHVAIDGKYCASFAHRTDLPPNGEKLILQVMTADDYGTNLGLVVHEIWWGHKDTMPGLPGAVKERKPAPARSTDRRGDHSNDSFADLHVGNLPPMRSPEEENAIRARLRDLFDPYGAYQVKVFHRGEKDFGFIKFQDHSSAAKALEDLSGEEINGWKIRLSRPKGVTR